MCVRVCERERGTPWSHFSLSSKRRGYEDPIGDGESIEKRTCVQMGHVVPHNVSTLIHEGTGYEATSPWCKPGVANQ